jgi:hypothetical protein
MTGSGAVPITASIRINPSTGNTTPVALAVFSYRNDNVTVSEAGLVGSRGSNFRTYVEAGGTAGASGSIQSGLAITNAGSEQATVTLELWRLDGTATGLTSMLIIPSSGQTAKFLNQLFPSLSGELQGVLRISSNGPIGVVGLRTRYNERGDFLFTTVPPLDESAAVPATGFVFPHLADSGGYTTQFIIYSAAGSATSGNLYSVTPGGQPLALMFR